MARKPTANPVTPPKFMRVVGFTADARRLLSDRVGNLYVVGVGHDAFRFDRCTELVQRAPVRAA